MMTSFIGDPLLVHLLLKPWLDGRGRAVRYYLDGWRRDLPEAAAGARAYFDTEGWLHVDGCPDPDARRLIEEWAVRWHCAARERLGKTGPRLGWSCPVSAVIGRFARPIAPGFVQLSCGGESVNLDEGQVARYGAMEAAYDPEACRYAADTGYPRLDRVLGGLLWELSAPTRPCVALEPL